jgi:signal transduction histidine kinase
MVEPMPVPDFTRRAALRVIVIGLLVAAVVGGIGLIGEQRRFGANLGDARQRIDRDVREQFFLVSERLALAAEQLARDPLVATVSQTREQGRIRQLFDRLGDVESMLRLPDVAITVYGAEARPLAWVGRPASLPIGRITGSDALFLAESPLGLRLTQVTPIDDLDDGTRRAATLVVEAPLPGTDVREGVPEGFVIATSVVPVPVRRGVEAASAAGAIAIESRTGEPLAVVDVPADEIDAARRAWRTRTTASVVVAVAAMLLLLCGPLLDWRRQVRTIPRHIGLTATVLALLVAARAIAWWATGLTDVRSAPLSETSGPLALLLASPLDFLLTVLCGAGVVALAISSFEQWRQSRRLRVSPVPSGRPLTLVAFLLVQIAAGAAAGGLALAYEWFLRRHLAPMPYDLLHVSLNPLDGSRLAIGVGLVVLHAMSTALAVLLFRLARAPWVVGSHHRGLRALVLVLWLAPAVAVLTTAMADWDRPPVLAATLIVGLAVAASWRLRRYRAALEHASQAARLTAFFVALAIPSVVAYPSLLDAHGRARRQLVESRYAPEVVNQRRSLQLQMSDALGQIDAMPDLTDLVEAGEPAAVGPPSTDAAFHVWERTVLKNQRSTSIELHDAEGVLVSRFALELPQAGVLQTYKPSSCDWEVFEEVAPFFAEERRLLHAGKGVCRTPGDIRSSVGALAVHVMLDYSNLSFISAQSPYVALLRDSQEVAEAAIPRDPVEFTVYGWSRRPLYMSGRTAWPLAEDVFRRIYSSRDPFWAALTRGDTDYDVYFLNDRGAIYALGYARASTVGHLITLAEIVALASFTYLGLLVAGLVYGRIAARTPASGRELLRELRASFYRKLFLAFVAAAVIPVLTLALVTRAYIATLMQTDLEMEAARTAASASRVVEDVGTLEVPGGEGTAIIDDDLVVWLSRVIAQDVNIFDGSGLLASSERNLFASGLLPTRTQGDVFRSIMLEGRPSYVGPETVAGYSYLIAAAPVRVQNREAILTVPLTFRQQQIDAQIDELDRRVLLAAVLFIILGAVIGYWMAERIADPVNRLMKATGRIARGDLDARILATSTDEFRRLVEAFNRMAADLQRQRVELERTNRLAAWADMARQVAHDIKNPLTPIQLNAEHLRRVHQDRGAPLGPVLDECVNNVLAQVRLLRQIAGEFSSFASSPTVRRAPTRLRDVVDEVVEAYRVALAGRVAIDVSIPDGLPALLVDKTVLGRALTNITENALHAMPGGGTLRISAQRIGETEVELAISDTGIGMDRDALRRIFEPYFSTRASGTGLGLTIAKRNVELNGGSIAVESEKGVGTTVRLRLPIAEEGT